MMPCVPQAPVRAASPARLVLVVALAALSLSACQRKGTADITGSVPTPQQAGAETWRKEVEIWRPRFEQNPADAAAALRYARALRGLDQKSQTVAVLQMAAIRSPNNTELLSAYGKALADAGRYQEAAEVLNRAHSPEKPDWRVLSAQGAVADQVGNHAMAQGFYEAALKLVPDEPSVLSNLGLSYALAKKLPQAEQTLRQAADQPRADARVRQNLALVLSLQGKFGDAETVLSRDLPPEEAAAVLSDMKSLVAQPNSWEALKRSDAKVKPARR